MSKQTAALVWPVLCLFLQAAIPGAAAAPVTHSVIIEGMAYAPAVIKVKKGDRIAWTNKDLFPHTVTAVNRSFDSGEIAAGKTWTHVVTANGNQEYVCTFHPTMKGSFAAQ